MKYKFLKFTLDTDKKGLYSNNQPIEIPKGHYDLLLFMLKNTGKMLSRSEIIDKVWQGKYVTENSIDQIISKLRKVLITANKEVSIKTVYGKGLMFVPEVTIFEENEKQKVPRNSAIKFTAFLVLVIMTVFLVYFAKNYQSSNNAKAQRSLLLIMSSANASTGKDESDQWLNQASGTFIDQLFTIADIAKLKKFKQKPKYLDRQQYINNQWQTSPDLKVVTSQLMFEDDLYTIELKIIDRLKHEKIQSFTHQSLSLAMIKSSQWLLNQVDQPKQAEKIVSMIPDDSYVVELYMRGLSSLEKGEIEKANNYFELCLSELPNFHLARLQMAKVKSAQGKPQESLALLDTLSNSLIFQQMEIEIESIRGDIYDTQGKYVEARDLYISVLEKYATKDSFQLDDMRYNLSQTYAALAEYDSALNELGFLQQKVDPSQNLELLAHVLQKQASILQHLGHIKKAQESALHSLEVFNQLEDLLGQAKLYITLARISTHQGDYAKSVDYLEQALIINRSLEYKLGVGATLNELIYVLMVKGEFDKAWQANVEMNKIALEIDYTAMLQISIQYSEDISRSQKKFKAAEIYLQEHLQLAKASRNKRSLLKNKLLAIDLYLDQERTNDILLLINGVQEYIDETKEIRLQPRINLHLARYNLLIDEVDKAISLLLLSKELAKSTEDGETIIEINNLLAQHYVDSNQAQKALSLLEDSLEYKPLSYPYLLIKSKANKMLGNYLKALDLANECKITSNQWWSIDDDVYLDKLKQSSNHIETNK